MAAADAEIEATFELTPQEAYDADRRDKQAQRDNLSPDKALQAEKDRKYRREHQTEIKEKKRDYRKKNAEKLRAYYQANKERISAWKKAWYQRKKQVEVNP